MDYSKISLNRDLWFLIAMLFSVNDPSAQMILYKRRTFTQQNGNRVLEPKDEYETGQQSLRI